MSDYLDFDASKLDAKLAKVDEVLAGLGTRLSNLSEVVSTNTADISALKQGAPAPDAGTPTDPDPPTQPTGEWDICLSHYRYTPVIVRDASSPTGYTINDPRFVQLYGQFRTIRALNWCGLLNRDVNWTWDQRVTHEHMADWDKTGLPIEALIEVANACNADLWWCGPQQADDEFVERAADLFATKLNGRVLVEWGNENWDSARGWFYHGNRPWDEGIRHYADDSAVNFEIMRRVLGDKLVAIMSGQKDNLGVLGTHILPHMESRGTLDWVDAISCSGYFGNRPDNWQVDLVESKTLMSAHARMARLRGLDFFIYELNQHIFQATSDMSLVDSDPVIEGVRSNVEHAKSIGAKRICMYSGAGRRYPNAPWPMYSTNYKPFVAAKALGMPTL